MAEIIECPQCRRQLRLDESHIGQLVQCPSCQRTFTAQAPTPAPPPPRYESREQEVPRPRPQDNPPRRPRYDDDDDYPRRGSPNFADDDRLEPHRGGTIQVLGILSLVFCWMWIACLVLSIITIVMANTDLDAMQRRRMDGSGENATRSGRVCAILALVAMPMLCIGCCVFRASLAGGAGRF